MKKIIYKFIFLIFILSNTFKSYAQLRSIFKNIISSEKVILRETAVISSKNMNKGTRFLFKKSDEVLIKISNESKISEGFKKNVKDFGEDIIDYGSEFITTDTPDSETKNTSSFNYLNEIEINNLNPHIYKILCAKFKKDTLNRNELKLALTGQTINNISISKEKLYKLYFILSDKFAYNELIKIYTYYSGNKIKQEKIEALALDRGLVIDSEEKTSKEEETSYIDIIFGFLILILILYIIFKIYIKIKLLVQKIIALFSKKN